ncbi:UNVERIFIED_CONTAM: hypothetical protein GTU68_059167 [Idotea baltica]|nr:hypothetical protein [Idotea baltica]
MKLVAASKLKRATDAIVQMRPYARKLSDILANIAGATEGDVELEYAIERPVNKVLLVVITSDKGLCGAFNANIIKKARLAIDNEYAEHRAAGNVSIMTLGKKSYDFFKKYDDCEILDEHFGIFKDLKFESTAAVVEEIMEKFAGGEYDEVYVAYSQFKNAAVQNIKFEKFLPIKKLETPEGEVESTEKSDYIFEPSKEVLIKELAPKILKTQFHSYLLDNFASEHGARMTAMDSATENANDLLRDLKLKYNKERQAAITTELTEIVSGAAALEGS